MEIDKTGVHLSHCYQGEEWGWCKYGEDETCPARKEPVDTLAELIAAIRQHEQLTAEPEPGLATWNEAVRRSRIRIADACRWYLAEEGNRY